MYKYEVKMAWPAWLLTPGLLHQESDKGEEEEAGDGEDAGEPLREQTLTVLSLSCNTYIEVRGHPTLVVVKWLFQGKPLANL